MTLLNWFVAIILVICAIAIAAGREKAVELSPLQVCSLLGCGCLLTLILKRQNKQTSQLSKTTGKAVKVNESLYDLHKPGGSPSLQVLFFHGFQFGDYTEAHLSTWESGNGSCIWPQTWLVDKFPGAHVISVSYDAHVAKSSPQGTFDMYLIGENLISDLMEADIGQLPGCPVILVGHSFGGLVIKQLCLHAHDGESLRSRIASKQLKSFLDNVKGIFYYATPHHGISCMEKVAAHYSLSGPLSEYVKVLSTEAARLNSRFDHLCELYNNWLVQGLGESLPTTSDVFQNVVVAPEASTRGGQQFNVVEGADHISITKPKGKTSRSFYTLTGLLGTIVKKQAKVQHQACTKEKASPDNFQHLPKQIVGIDHVVKDVKAKLEKATSLGLVGMGGIGKTTIAKRLFNVLGPQYEYTCFIHEVKNIRGGVQSIKKAVLDNIHHQGKKIKVGMADDLNLLRGKRLLLVLDDVVNENPDLEVVSILQEDIDVDSRSRFIVTSRDLNVLKLLDDFYWIPFLFGDSSMRLFTSFAFRNQKDLVPPPSMQGLVEIVVAKCAGLPLALEVLGKYLYNLRSKQIWEQVIQALEKADKVVNFEEKLWAVLKLSYDNLKREDQEMFLDAATIWNGERLFDAKQFWSITTNRSEHIRWQHLVDISLVWESKEVVMHEQLRDLGRRIALTQGENGKCSRIWESQKAWELLSAMHSNTDETEEVVALRLDGGEINENVEERDLENLGNSPLSSTSNERLSISRNTLSKMAKLQCLWLTGVDIDHIQGTTFPSRLVMLKWADSMLTELPLDLGCLARLAILILYSWHQLKTLPSNFGQLTALRVVRIQHADKLESLPNSFVQLVNLELLELAGCGLKGLPDSFGQLVNLKDLRLQKCGLKSLPDSFGQLVHLERLVLSWSLKLESLPKTFGRLSKLKYLKLEDCGLRSLPSTIGRLSQLRICEISDCDDLKALPISFGHLPVLEELNISFCSHLQELPATFGKLATLKSLQIYDCHCLHRLPDTFGQLVGLEELHLRNSFLESVPNSIGCLQSLKTLELNWAKGTAFPTLPRCLGDEITELNYSRFPGLVFDVVDGRFSLQKNLQDKQERFIRESHASMMKKVRLKDYQGALEDYALDVETLDVETLSDWNRSYFLQERGILKRLNDDLEGARQDLTDAWDGFLKIGDDDYECRKHRGFVKFLLGDHEGARIDGKRAMEIEPSHLDEPDYAFNICEDGSLELSCLGGERIQYLDFDLK